MYILFRCKFTLVILYHLTTRYFQHILVILFLLLFKFSTLLFYTLVDAFQQTQTPYDLSRLYVTLPSNVSHMAFPRTKRVEREKKKSLGQWNLAGALESREKEARTETRSVGRRNLTVSPSPLPPSPPQRYASSRPAPPFSLDPLDCLPSLVSFHSCVRTRVAFARSKIANRMYSYCQNFISMTRGARSIRINSAIPLIHIGLCIDILKIYRDQLDHRREFKQEAIREKNVKFVIIYNDDLYI